MRYISLLTFVFGLILLSCASAPQSTSQANTADFGVLSTAQQDDDDKQDDATSQPDDDKEKGPKKEKVKLPLKKKEIKEGGEKFVEFKLEVSADDPSRAKGLSERKEIKELGGMIFIYPRNGYHSFWMFNCLVDIDIIFVNSKGIVTAKYEMKKELPRQAGERLSRYEGRLKRYRSRKPAQFAIELKSGWLKKLDIEVGDEIKLEVKRLTKIAKDNEPDWP